MFGDWVQSGSHLAILAVLILSGTGLPIPEEVTVVAAAIASAPPNLAIPVWSALLCCILGAIGGDCVMYGIGRYFGRSVFRHKWLARFLTPSREKKIEDMIEKQGVKLFFLARFMVGFRSPMYLTCGIMRVPFMKFLLADLLSALVVVGSFFALGYYHGQSFLSWLQKAEIGVTIGVVTVVIVLIGLHYYHLRKQSREIDADEEEEEATSDASGAHSEFSTENDAEAGEITLAKERDDSSRNGSSGSRSTESDATDREKKVTAKPQTVPLKTNSDHPASSVHA
jgi:membrane protein DedA with SNARE-associated domain